MSAGARDPAGGGAGGFVVDLEPFQGPLDLLLELAQKQKVDLGRISILSLAEQYLAYLDGSRARDLPVAAEYLVMAAWLAYLKSQLRLPPAERAEPDPLAVAGALEERLRLLDAIRRGAGSLLARPRLGEGRLPRGAPEGLPVEVRPEYGANLALLFGAYGAAMRRGRQARMTFPPRRLDSVEAALERLSRLLTGHDWRDLMRFLPPGLCGDGDDGGLGYRSAVASSLVAGLELARAGAVELVQAFPFGPVMVRRL